MAKDQLDAKLEALSRRTGKGIDRAAAVRFMEEYDLEPILKENRARWSFKVLSPKAGKEYDENIETHSYLLFRDGELVIFQPHDPFQEGYALFANAKEAEAAAKRNIETLAVSAATQRRDADFARSVE